MTTLTCPCGMTLTYEGEPEGFGSIVREFSAAHLNHSAPVQIALQPTPPYVGDGLVNGMVPISPVRSSCIDARVHAATAGIAAQQTRFARAQ